MPAPELTNPHPQYDLPAADGQIPNPLPIPPLMHVLR
jgi:hypothetical protein